MRTVASGVGVLLCLASMAAHAQLFSCRDAAGRHIASDRPIPECANRWVREVRPDGIVKREIAPPLSAEERRRKMEADAEAQRLARLQRDARQRDQALLLRYKSPGDIAAARQRELETVQDRVRLDRLALEEAERQSAEAQTAVRQGGDKVALAVRDRAERALENVELKKRLLEQYDRDIAAIHRKYDEKLLRFRQLTDSAGDGTDAVRVSVEAGSER